MILQIDSNYGWFEKDLGLFVPGGEYQRNRITDQKNIP
jgi:hypothetical protein